jgi:transcriptional regulator with XRE-family HTH domain
MNWAMISLATGAISDLARISLPLVTEIARKNRGAPMMAGDKYDQEIGERLRRARVASGMSQGRLAKEVGVSFQQIQKYEAGANRISSSRLYTMARVLGVGMDYFFNGLELLDNAQSSGGGAGQRVISDRTIRIAQTLNDMPDEKLRLQLEQLISVMARHQKRSG